MTNESTEGERGREGWGLGEGGKATHPIKVIFFFGFEHVLIVCAHAINRVLQRNANNVTVGHALVGVKDCLALVPVARLVPTCMLHLIPCCNVPPSCHWV